MANSKSAGNTNKVSFGKKKTGATKKSFNNHTPKVKAYRGQGR